MSAATHPSWRVYDPYPQVVGSGAATSYTHLPFGQETMRLDTAVKVLRMTSSVRDNVHACIPHEKVAQLQLG